MKKVIYIIVSLFLLGCGADSILQDIVSSSNKYGKAQLGVMSSATVKLYEVNGKNTKLLATDKTTPGISIETIGNFNLFLEKLENDKFYLYEVSNGFDYDVEDDGVVNNSPTENKGKFHLLAKGSTLKTTQSARVTIISEIIYQRVKPFLGDGAARIEEEMERVVQQVIETDIDGNGNIGVEDILKYNPINHQANIQALFRGNLSRYNNNILNDLHAEYETNTLSEVKPVVGDFQIEVFENTAVGTLIADVNMTSKGDSNITKIRLFGNDKSSFAVNKEGKVKVLIFLDYEAQTEYNLSYIATNDAGDSNEANITIKVKNIYETLSEYPKSEVGVQAALDNGENDYILNELLNNRDSYADLNNDEVQVNIAAAYVGKSDYTTFDILGAMNSSQQNNNFNGFVNTITNSNDSVKIIENLKEADKYYNEVVAGLDCNNTSGLTALQKESCVNLGLVRLTSLSNSIKLLFGGDSETVTQWSNGVEVNSTQDLNGNGVTDEADASACAVVYANNPTEGCKDGSNASYRGNVTFRSTNRSYTVTLIEVDVGSPELGYKIFYKLITNKTNNNSPLLTSGICMKDFTRTTTNQIDGVNYFPCPTLDSSSQLMELKSNLEQGANIQALFPHGSETKDTLENYIENITGSRTGTVGLDNLADYLQVN